MTKKIFIYLACLSAVFLLIPRQARSFSGAPSRPISCPVRVAVIINAPQIDLKIRGDYSILALPLLEPLKKGRGLKNMTVKPTRSGVSMGQEHFKIYGIKIRAERAADISVNGRRFRGEMDIIRTESIKLTVVNHLDIEDYLNGVLYHEVSHWWPMEALKAQAIASRTFALYKCSESGSGDYDLRSDIYAQVYGGKTSEKFRTNRAVRATAGKVLIYKGKILPAYFHATCGGHTENASSLWKTDIAPLRGRPCSYCEGSPHYNWVKGVPLDMIEKNLKIAGYRIKGIKDIKVLSRNSSGRADIVGVTDSLGLEKITANKFRLAVGPNLIRSANFTVNIKGGMAVFIGRGWGHGVGMCQWGACYLAAQGVKAEDILKFYYPSADIADYDEAL